MIAEEGGSGRIVAQFGCWSQNDLIRPFSLYPAAGDDLAATGGVSVSARGFGVRAGAEGVRGGFGGVPSGLDRWGLNSLPTVIMDYFLRRWRALFPVDRRSTKGLSHHCLRGSFRSPSQRDGPQKIHRHNRL